VRLLDGSIYLIINTEEITNAPLSVLKGCLPAFNIRTRAIRSIIKSTLVEVVSLEVKVSSGDPELETVDGPAPESVKLLTPREFIEKWKATCPANWDPFAFGVHISMQEAWNGVYHDWLLWIASRPGVLTPTEIERFLNGCGWTGCPRDCTAIDAAVVQWTARQYSRGVSNGTAYAMLSDWLRTNTKPNFSRT
jgi:hypothetical protein